MITTDNLRLLSYEWAHVEALLRGKDELSALLQVTIPAGWPQFPEAFSLPTEEPRPAYPSPREWPGFFFLHPRERALVGSGGFKGPPDADGAVEIGYEIAPEYWNRGIATEAARGMIDYAFSQAPVGLVMAHTLAEPNASNRVLQKVGMRFVAAVEDPDEGTIWRWQIGRAEYERARARG
ncbi:MAG: GNAT family N-acetyltransferase [Chloroflexota bacterium]